MKWVVLAIVIPQQVGMFVKMVITLAVIAQDMPSWIYKNWKAVASGRVEYLVFRLLGLCCAIMGEFQRPVAYKALKSQFLAGRQNTGSTS